MAAAGRIQRGGDIPPVAELVRSRASQDPDGLAVIDASRAPARKLTWQELSGQADQVAARLADLGVKPGKAVALQAPNWAESVVCALAVLRAGGLVLPLLPGLGPRETGRVLGQAQARVSIVTGTAAADPALAGMQAAQHLVVIDREAPGAGPAAGRARPGPAVHWLSEILAGPSAAVRGDAGPGGQLGFTSGSTGQAKCIRHEGDVLTRATRLVADRLQITAADRVHVPCPLGHHSGFLYGMWLAWVTGSAQIVHGKWDARTALTALAAWRGTFTQLAPVMLADLRAEVERGASAPPSLRLCVVTGAPLPAEQAEQASRVLGSTVCRAWGSTETCMGTLVGPGDPPGQRWATDGRPLDGVRLRVVGAAGEPLAPPAEGSLEVTSPCQFRGYGNGPDFDRQALTADGWYRTGDVAALDEHGYLRITGRSTDVINRGGQKIPAALVEGLLAGHPGVAEIAVAPARDARLGERACAFVVAAAGQQVTLSGLQRYLSRQGVTRYYWPEQLELLPQLPRNAAGKVQKHQLQPYLTGAGREPSTFAERNSPNHAG